MFQVSGILDLNVEDLSERTMPKLLKLDKSVFSSKTNNNFTQPTHRATVKIILQIYTNVLHKYKHLVKKHLLRTHSVPCEALGVPQWTKQREAEASNLEIKHFLKQAKKGFKFVIFRYQWCVITWLKTNFYSLTAGYRMWVFKVCCGWPLEAHPPALTPLVKTKTKKGHSRFQM